MQRPRDSGVMRPQPVRRLRAPRQRSGPGRLHIIARERVVVRAHVRLGVHEKRRHVLPRWHPDIRGDVRPRPVRRRRPRQRRHRQRWHQRVRIVACERVVVRADVRLGVHEKRRHVLLHGHSHVGDVRPRPVRRLRAPRQRGELGRLHGDACERVVVLTSVHHRILPRGRDVRGGNADAGGGVFIGAVVRRVGASHQRRERGDLFVGAGERIYLRAGVPERLLGEWDNDVRRRNAYVRGDVRPRPVQFRRPRQRRRCRLVYRDASER